MYEISRLAQNYKELYDLKFEEQESQCVNNNNGKTLLTEGKQRWHKHLLVLNKSLSLKQTVLLYLRFSWIWIIISWKDTIIAEANSNPHNYCKIRDQLEFNGNAVLTFKLNINSTELLFLITHYYYYIYQQHHSQEFDYLHDFSSKRRVLFTLGCKKIVTKEAKVQ